MLNGLEVTLLWCSVLVPAGVLAALAVIDFREPEERLYKRPRAYGLAVLGMACLAIFSLLVGPVWENLTAVENLDAGGLRLLRRDLTGRIGPAVCLALIGAGALVVSRAHVPHGRRPGCRSCGYTFDRTTRVNITRCPECGAPWRWIGGLRTGGVWDAMRLMIGAMLLVGAAGLAGVLSL